MHAQPRTVSCGLGESTAKLLAEVPYKNPKIKYSPKLYIIYIIKIIYYYIYIYYYKIIYY